MTESLFIYLLIGRDDVIMTSFIYESRQVCDIHIANMEKIEKRAVIKYLFIKGMSTKEIHDDMFVRLHWGTPDLALSAFYLFPLLKKHLRGTQYASDNDIIQSVEGF